MALLRAICLPLCRLSVFLTAWQLLPYDQHSSILQQPQAPTTHTCQYLIMLLQRATDVFALGNVQVASDLVDETVVNAPSAGLQPGSCVRRTGTRISLTVRQVQRVKKNLIRL